MSPNQLPPQNTIALTTAGMERERERLREGMQSERVIKDMRGRKRVVSCRKEKGGEKYID